MLDFKQLLEVQYYDDSETSYDNYKINLGQIGQDTATITLGTDDYLYIGFYKTVKSIYFDIPTPNENDTVLTAEYYNGTDYTEIDIYDDTKGFTRNGFIQFEEISNNNWSNIEVNSIDKHWIRISTSVEQSATIFNFIGLLFSDDKDLQRENPYILGSNLLMGETNHLKAHIAARDEIVQKLIKDDNVKRDADGNIVKIDAWDLLDIQEVRQGAIFLALAKIYFNLSDDADDHWMNKSDKYRKFYNTQINLPRFSIDSDDDGQTDNSERQAISSSISLYR